MAKLEKRRRCFSLTGLWSRSDQTRRECVRSVLRRGGVASGPDRTLVEARDRTRRACVRSQVTYADVGRETWRVEEKNGSDAGLRPVEVHLTRPIVVWAL